MLDTHQLNAKQFPVQASGFSDTFCLLMFGFRIKRHS